MFRNRGFRKTCIILFWLLVWWILAVVVDNSILLVTPQAVVGRFFEFIVQQAFWQSVAGSLLRIATGFVLGCIVALLLATVSFRYPLAEELIQPLMSLMKTVPVASFVVLLLIWWGSGFLAVAICFLVVLPNIYINTLEGLKATDRNLLEMAKVFRISGRNCFFYIYRPALRPFLASAMKLALGMCWKSGVAAEVIGMPTHSIGGQLYLSKIHLDTAGVLDWTGVVILLSLCFEKMILWLMDKFFAWKPQVGRAKWIHSVEQESGKDARYNGAQKIVLEHINKSYGENVVLTDVSAVYEPGHTYYLTSPSGSGKTTILRILSGLEKPDNGTVEGVNRCSVVFQEDRLCEEYSAIVNVAMVTGDENAAREALSKLLDTQTLIQPCKELSGGMKRRVALVRAMEASSEVVLLDEPFTGMDVDTKRMAEEYIRERQNGRILIIATHI